MDHVVERNIEIEIQNSIRRSVEKIATNVNDELKVSSNYINSLSDFIYNYACLCVARDLIAFTNHASRKNVSEDDVILLSRKTKYHDHLIQYGEENGILARKNQGKGEKKK